MVGWDTAFTQCIAEEGVSSVSLSWCADPVPLQLAEAIQETFESKIEAVSCE